MYEEALNLKALCDSYNVPLIINDRVDVALAVGAAGVHVGQDDLPCSLAKIMPLLPRPFAEHAQHIDFIAQRQI